MRQRKRKRAVSKKLYEIFKKFLHTMASGAIIASRKEKDKFSKLKQYLENCGKTELTLTFTDIEAIIGYNLCKSAYNYSAYWTPSPTHTMPNTILAAGFKVVSVDLLSNSLLLRKQ